MDYFRRKAMIVKGEQAKEIIEEIKRKPTHDELKSLTDVRKRRLPTKRPYRE